MSNLTRAIPIALAALDAALPLVAADTALAKDRPRVVKSGGCSKQSTWKLKLRQEDSRIETEFEVDQNRTGVTWNVVIRLRGAIVFSGKRTTRGPSGSFTVRRLLSDRSGPDRIAARATSPSGEVCRASATIG